MMQKKEIHPCFECLKETEQRLQKGSWKELPEPIKYWYEMCEKESQEIEKFVKKFKPKNILEIGCGAGRIINILLSIDYPKEITAVEKDKKMFESVKPLFKQKNVHLINEDINQFLKKSEKFDLTLCMMNTFGNIDNEELFRLIAVKSKHFIFTVYDRKTAHLRAEIYKSKGHKKFTEKNGTYFFEDKWVKGLKSKSYSKEEIEKLCRQTGKKFSIKKISKLLFLIHLFD